MTKIRPFEMDGALSPPPRPLVRQASGGPSLGPWILNSDRAPATAANRPQWQLDANCMPRSPKPRSRMYGTNQGASFQVSEARGAHGVEGSLKKPNLLAAH
jgi:hypothetical protein